MGQSLNDYVARATRYAHAVISGDIPACRWVRLACQRQINDLARTNWRWKFDREAANRVCRFIELLPHIKGRWKSKTITLEDWQRFELTTIFGWVDRDTGLRRFRKALVVIPRKNAKTTIAAGVGLYMLGPDGEPGAEVLAAAVNRGQVTGPSGVWTVAHKMAKRSHGFCERFGVEPLAHSIVIESEAAAFKPLSRDSDSEEGLNPHCWIADELHAHKTREIFDVCDEATGARKQPLGFIISTEGDNATGVFAEQVAYGQQVLSGSHEDDTYFALIYTIDPEDDWTSPAAWRKANPNLGVSVYLEDLETRCRQAQKNPASQSSFLTKRLNVRVGAGEAYFSMLAWDRICRNASLKIEDFYGQECVIGLDLASKIDLAAKVFLFPNGKEWAVFGSFYLPEEQLQRGNPNYDFYRGWVDRGHITITPGNVIDYGFIERDLLEDHKNFELTAVCFDPYQATQLSTRMIAENLPMIEVPQTVLRLSEPMKEVGARVLAGSIRHNGDPVLSWTMGNVQAKVDAKENVYPRKQRNENKIDGAVALIMATSRAIVGGESSEVSVRMVG